MYFGGCFDLVGSVADHPENGAGRLLHLMGAAPSALHRGQAKVPDLHRQTFMQEDVFAAVKESPTRSWNLLSNFTSNIPTGQQSGKDTVGLHVTMNDVLRVQVAGKEQKERGDTPVALGRSGLSWRTHSMPCAVCLAISMSWIILKLVSRT